MNSTASSFATTLNWHDPTDVQVRKLMMTRLRSHPALAQHHPILQDTSTHPSLLQRLEWMLYHCAGSLSEYLHQPSLERRVQSLVTHYKRKCSDLEPSDTTRSCKRTRSRIEICEDNCRIYKATNCVFDSNIDLLQQVYSFLDGMDILRSRSVNKFLYLHAPSLVKSLHLDIGSISSTIARKDQVNGLNTIILECKNLTSLRISNQANQLNVKAGVVFPRALASNEKTTLTTASYGYYVVCAVANALEAGACLLLERLELVAPFHFATESDAVIVLLRSLTNLHTNFRNPLQHLVLDATFLGDCGISQIADLFETHISFFERLQTLTVRNNFMGESGCRALLEAIETFSELRVLDLSRNILSNTDAFALADLLDVSVTDLSMVDMDESWEALSLDSDHFCMLGLAGLRSLKLQENFITCDGLHAITIALCSRKDFVATEGDVVADVDQITEDRMDEEHY
ncbi:Leucine-rich repeat, ribonuclease inhibitor subtype [Plasmopara halstedii]|uniref:Leucine-rich repeat, ribonuclease inhibitor subtype n=1 Tax=Plasmopara halstedii TaxID=4781 RepID=A0A0P1A8G7_PLAHL|nr:Leucine-rich repeat, ribonuclease inhibitor subtype [Plasmopara halstedii]CEG36996.1 Leucine-rich repeat, ribonuclease inhibitor subtype [Plasmopara halstedii]|eukprot:XP_024573365.1 Leucine-rich repeat, ribonuclease inhibitor subtype [Plasmopara halstedii]